MEITTVVETSVTELFNKLGFEGDAERQSHLNHFFNLGLPDKKNEEYKFTPFGKVGEAVLSNLSINDSELTKEQTSSLFYAEEGHHLVYVNGSYRSDLSLIATDESSTINDSSSLSDLNKVADSKDVFTSLNTAFTSRYASVTVAKNKEAKTIFVYHIINAEEPNLVNPRLLIAAEQGAKAEVVEKVMVDGEANTLINMVTEIDVAANASVNYSKIQYHDKNAVIHDGMKINQHRDSRFYANTFTFSGKQIRNNLDIKLLDENCETHMHGLYLTDGTTHVDNHTSVDHTVPNCFSNEVYKGILDGRSTAVFNGKIYVRPNAQQTNAFQANNNISLSDLATIHTKPQLEIWADDVKCSHGCTIGQLDEEALFYLRARGLDPRSAKSMMLVAFAEDTFEYVTLDCVKEELHRIIQSRLG